MWGGKSYFLSLSHNFVISTMKWLVQILSEVPSIASIQWSLAKTCFDFLDNSMNYTNLGKQRARVSEITLLNRSIAKDISSKLTLTPASETN